MTVTRKIEVSDVVTALNGTLTGSTAYFWGQSITSGSVADQIDRSNYYLYGILGETKMDSSDTVVSNHIKTAELDYACMRLLIVLSGGVIVDGFDWTAGITVKQPHIMQAYMNLISQFKESAQTHLRALQPIARSADWNAPTWAKTAPSPY